MLIHKYVAALSVDSVTFMDRSPRGGITLLPVANLQNNFRPERRNIAINLDDNYNGSY